jgi:hypothetical protein
MIWVHAAAAFALALRARYRALTDTGTLTQCLFDNLAALGHVARIIALSDAPK